MDQSAKTRATEMALGVAAVVTVIVCIQLRLPDSVTVGPWWAIPAVEAIGIPAGYIVARQTDVTPQSFRIAGGVYLTFLVAASVLNASLLFLSLLGGSDDESADTLLFAGFGVLIINVLSFGLVYWWLDGGGPTARAEGKSTEWDFLYPQQQLPGSTWLPSMSDYFFTAYTNIIAFSPTDTMPLTHRVKFLFTIQSAVSLVTVLVTVTRAINLLQ